MAEYNRRSTDGLKFFWKELRELAAITVVGFVFWLVVFWAGGLL